MRKLRIVPVLATALCALGVATGTAGAAQFTASRMPKPVSESEPGVTKGFPVGSTELGGTERSQELRFGPFHIYCTVKTFANSIAEGAISWTGSETFSTEARFEKCLTKANYEGTIFGTKTQFNLNAEKKPEPVKFVYHVNGFVGLGAGETESEVEVGSGAASITVGGKVCKINWPSQIVPAKAVEKPEAEYSAAVYSNNEVAVPSTWLKKFPSGFQQKLVITNDFKNMEWSFEEGQCLGEDGFGKAAKHEEGKTAFYRGSFQEEMKGGNLGFEA
jgi:hypothetical protein